MAFSQQHYQQFADILKKMTSRKDQEELAIGLIKIFKADNPRFDSFKFLKAAGIEENPRIYKASYPTESKVNESFGNVGMKLVELLPTGKIEGRTGFVREAPIKESSAPVAGASYAGNYGSQKKSYDLFKFRVGDYTVFVATIDGKVASNGKMPYFWSNGEDAMNQIAKWR